MAQQQKLIIERVGRVVRIILECRDDYRAIEMFEQLDKDADSGRVMLRWVADGEPERR